MGQGSSPDTILEAYAIDDSGTGLTFVSQHALPNIASGAVGMALDDVIDRLFVSYEGSGTVYVFDGTTYTEIHQITTVGTNIAGMFVNTDTNTLYLVDRGQTTVYMYNTITYAYIGSESIDYGAYGLAYDPANNHLYLTDYSSIHVYDMGTFAYITSYSTGYNAVGIALDYSDPSNVVVYTTDNVNCGTA